MTPREQFVSDLRNRTPVSDVPASVLEQIRRDIEDVKAAQKGMPRGVTE
jgi:hypothetical protein